MGQVLDHAQKHSGGHSLQLVPFLCSQNSNLLIAVPQVLHAMDDPLTMHLIMHKSILGRRQGSCTGPSLGAWRPDPKH